jgi:hypothetical protein
MDFFHFERKKKKLTFIDIYSDFALRKHINHLSFSLALHFGIDAWKTKTKPNPDTERKNQQQRIIIRCGFSAFLLTSDTSDI